MTTTQGYTLTALSFFPDVVPASASLGYASLRISPLGLKLENIVILHTPHGIRAIFPKCAVMSNDEPAIRYGKPLIAGLGKFESKEAWARFSDAAIAAIEAKYPGQLLSAANTKLLPARPADVAA
jgi:hypothetical protein